MHEGYCVAFSLTWERETDDWKKKEKKKNEDYEASFFIKKKNSFIINVVLFFTMRFLFNSHKIVFLVLRSRFTFVSKLHYVIYIYTHVCLLIEISLYFLFTIIISLHTICDFVLRYARNEEREREREKKLRNEVVSWRHNFSIYTTKISML